MADVFISYASEDRDRAATLASALEELGWTVWWDRKIITGQAFDDVIERELDAAKSVVVLWSTHSIASEWVKNEAAAASERAVLVPARIDAVRLPLEFRRKQTAELIDWKGQPSHSGFQALCDGVGATMGRKARPRTVEPARRPARRWRWAAIAGALFLVPTLYVMAPWERTSTEPSPSVVTELADLVTGTYFGAVISDSKGSSRSDVLVSITKLDQTSVRVTSEYGRVGTVDVPLTRIENQVVNAGGDTPFVVDLGQDPVTLLVDPRGELAYRGTKQ